MNLFLLALKNHGPVCFKFSDIAHSIVRDYVALKIGPLNCTRKSNNTFFSCVTLCFGVIGEERGSEANATMLLYGEGEFRNEKERNVIQL